MDAKVRDLQRLASMGDVNAREQLWWEAQRLRVFGPGLVIGGSRDGGVVDPYAGFRSVLRGMAFFGDVAARRAWNTAQAEYVKLADNAGIFSPEGAERHRASATKLKIPSTLTQDLLTFSFGTVGTTAIACALARFALENYGQDLRTLESARGGLPNDYGHDLRTFDPEIANNILARMQERIEAVEAMIPVVIERLRERDEENTGEYGGWNGLIKGVTIPIDPGFFASAESHQADSRLANEPLYGLPRWLPALPALPNGAPRLMERLYEAAEILGESGFYATSWHRAERPATTLWSLVIRTEAAWRDRSRASSTWRHPPSRATKIAVVREVKAYCLAKVAPVMSLGLIQ